MKAYCIKCKTQKEMTEIQDTLIEGKRAKKGVCPECGTKMFHILSHSEQLSTLERIWDDIRGLLVFIGTIIYTIVILVGLAYLFRAFVRWIIY